MDFSSIVALITLVKGSEITSAALIRSLGGMLPTPIEVWLFMPLMILQIHVSSRLTFVNLKFGPSFLQCISDLSG